MARDDRDAPREVELKLELDPAELEALLAHPLVAGGEPPATLRSVYYDTADGRLARAGCSLRVRATADGFVQTVKADAGAAAGLFDRAEWEVPVTGPRPSGRALKGTPAAEALKRSAKGEGAKGEGTKALRPLFTTVMERTKRRVARGETVASLTVDSGRVEDGTGRVLPLCEVELELERGAPEDLFALARDLGAAASLRPGTRSKSERGRALVAGTLGAVAKAEPVVLPAGATATMGFQAIARSCLRHLALNEAALLAERRPEAVHQTRVALRRLRAALHLFRAVVADEVVEGLKAELKRLAAPLGRARNLDVFLSETLPAEIERRPEEAGLPDLVRRVEAERVRAYDAVIAVLGGPEWRRFLLDLVAWIEAGPWLRAEDRAARRAMPLAAFGAEALTKLRRKVAKKGRHLARLDPRARHRVRIGAKRLRYAAEFLEAAYRGGRTRRRQAGFVEALSALQEELGALNDIATGHALAEELVASLPPEPRGRRSRPAPPKTLFAAGIVAADVDGRAAGHLERAEAAHSAFRKAKPFWR